MFLQVKGIYREVENMPKCFRMMLLGKFVVEAENIQFFV